MIKYSIPLFLTVLLMGCENSDKEDSISSEKPNIILIMTDDMGWGDWGMNDHPFIQTPELDRMARNGAHFTNFYSASPVCSPTRASCMTGRHPERIGIVTANRGHLPMDETNLAKLLKDQGYSTGHFGKWHLGTLTRDTLDANRGGRPQHRKHYSPPWLNGFDECFSTESKVPTYNPMVTPPADAMDIGGRKPGKHFETYYWTGPGEMVTEGLEGDDSEIIMTQAINFIKKRQNDQPFFTVIWFHAPHLPVIAGNKHRKMYDSLSVDQQHFYGVISSLDEQIGRLNKELEKLGEDQNTMIWFTSDNGPEGKEVKARTQGTTKGLAGRKRSLHEGGVRVPGVLYWPEMISPKKVDIPASTSDYLPTIMAALEVTEYERSDKLDGENVLPVLMENKRRVKPIHFIFGNQMASRNGDFKIYKTKNDSTYTMYNIVQDPYEVNDISNNHPDMKRKMVEEYEMWLENVNKDKSRFVAK